MSHLFLNWNILDYILAVIVFISVIFSFFRGFVREIISLVTWFLAFYATLTFSPALSGLFRSAISNPKAAYITAAIVIFVIVLILGAIVSKLASGLVKLSLLGFFDKIVGIVFGVARGVLLVIIILFAIQLTPFHDAAWMKASQLAIRFQPCIAHLNALLPKDLLKEAPTTLMGRINTFGHSLISHIKK